MNMKELSIEEKAKRYDELKVTAQELEEDGCFDKITLFDLFPELKESEDEESKKWILEYLYDGLRMSDEQFKGQFKSAIAWLEKQGEYKPTDKTEPKFKNGQWIVWQDKCYKVNDNGCGYELVDQNGLSTSLEYETIDKNAHLLTIQDAKEESKKIEQSPIDVRTTGYWHVEYVEQKPAWSEEDERRYRGLHNLIYYTQYCDSRKELSDWLKSLKDRVQPQLKQEWSVDDERAYRSVLYDFEHHFPLNCVQQEFVKSHIQPQNRWKPSDEQMNAFDAVLVYNPPFSNECRNNLITLYNDLKKLMEE